MLSRLNYAVTTVRSGEDAVEYLRNNPVDLVILVGKPYTLEQLGLAVKRALHRSR